MAISIRKLVLLGAMTVVLAGMAVNDARAEGFISPLAGYNFSGDSGCSSLRSCEDKRLNVGLSLGSLGSALGFEEEFVYVKNFFRDTSGLDSSVLTLMSNLMLAPQVGPVRPYVLGGLGLMRTRVSATSSSTSPSGDNNLAWDAGGGVMVFFGEHVGVRGDVRYLHAFRDLSVSGITLGDTKLDFGRAGAALVLKF